MNTFPVFLNFVEITKYQNSIKNTDKQIEYCQYLISVCNEAEKNISDEDVEKFLDKYDLRLKIDNIINECTLDRDDIENSNILFCPNCQQFSNKIFNKLHNRLAAIKNNSLIELSWLNLYKITVLIDFEFAFLEDQVYRKFDEFDDKRKSLMWIKELERKLNKIYDLFPDSLLAKLFQDFDLGNYFYVNESPKLVTVNGFLCLDTKYQNFKNHLNRHFLPFITKQKELLEMDIAIEDTKNYLSNGVTNEDVIFRQWDFDFNKVKFFSDNAFDSIEYKIQYLSYVIKCLKIKIPVNIQNSKFSTELSKIEEELKYLQNYYDLKKSKGTLINDEINYELLSGLKQVLEKICDSDELKPKKRQPASRAFSDLINHYFEIALGVYRVPKLEELASKSHSISFWSKRFDDEVFLMVLYMRIEKKLKSKRIKPEIKSLFVDLSNDVKSKIVFLSKNKSDDSGQTNKQYKGFEEKHYNDDDPYDYED